MTKIIVLTKKQQAKRKEKQAQKLKEAYDRGSYEGREQGKQLLTDQVAALIYAQFGREPGQPTATASVHKSLVGRVALTVDRRGDEIRFTAALKSYMPD